MDNEITNDKRLSHSKFLLAFLILSASTSASWRMSGISGLIAMSLCVLVLVLISRSSQKWAWGLGFVLIPIAVIAGKIAHDLSMLESAGSSTTQATPQVTKDRFGGVLVTQSNTAQTTIADPFTSPTSYTSDPEEEAQRAAEAAMRAAAAAQQAENAMHTAASRRSAYGRPVDFRPELPDTSYAVDTPRQEHQEAVIYHHPERPSTELPAWGNGKDPAKSVNSNQ